MSCLLGVGSTAHAEEHWVYRATVSLLLQSASFENQVDQIQKVPLNSKKLVNAVMGSPLSGRPPSNLVLAITIPKVSTTYLGSRLGILDTGTNTFVTVAIVSNLTLLAPGGSGAGAGEASVGSIPTGFVQSGEVQLSPFTIYGGGTGKATPDPSGPSLSLKLSGFHGLPFRNGTGAGYYAAAITKGTVRVSGRPIATVDL